MRRKIISVFLTLILTVPAAIRPDPLEGTSSFVRNDRVLTWSTQNTSANHLSDTIRINLDNNMSTSLNRTTGDKDRWYDSIYNRAELTYTAHRNLDVTVRAFEDWNRDTFSQFGGSLLTTSLESAVNYRPTRNLRLTAGLGSLFDHRFENEDSGTTATGSLAWSTALRERLRTSVNITGATSNLQRANNALTFRGEITYDAQLAYVSLDLAGDRRTQGYFSDVDRKRIEERARTEESLTLLLSRGTIESGRRELAVLFSTSIGAKRVSDTANDDERSSKYMNDSEGDISDVSLTLARGLGNHIHALVETQYIRDENNVERLSRSRTQTDVLLRSQIGAGFASDSLMVTGWIRRSRIDTPHDVPNDRDELKFEGSARYLRYFAVNFQTGLDFRVLETHYINIDASQSTQNKWIKTYQFSPFFVFSPVRSVRLQHTVNLYANHMDYDFDSETQPRSNITRRVSSESRIDAELSPRTRLVVGFMFEQNDYGNLDSKNRKLPVEEGIRRYGEISVEHRFADWLRLTPQYMYAIRRDTDIDRNELIRREVDQTFSIDGVLFEDRTGEYNLTFRVKRIIRDTEAYPTRIRDYIDVSMRYRF